MKFEPIQKTLKNGATVFIREAGKNDASALLQTVSECILESEYLITSIEEFNPTKQDQARWIKAMKESRNSILLVATNNNKIIGSIDLKSETRKRIRHNAILGISILRKWQNLGLGRILINCVLDWAKQNTITENIWLHVFATHTMAINLYKTMGFKEITFQRNYIKQADGSYIDNMIMEMALKA